MDSQLFALAVSLLPKILNISTTTPATVHVLLAPLPADSTVAHATLPLLFA